MTKVLNGHISTAQSCPLCGQLHAMDVMGLVYVDHVGHTKTAPVGDIGYSFCNCKNIWYTDWKNIKQNTYDGAYHDKYQNPQLKDFITRYAQKYLPMFKNTESKIFLEIGCASNLVLDEASKQGWFTYGIDINPYSKINETHEFIIGDVEDYNVLKKAPLADVIWASHVFEHFKDPIKMIKECYYKINHKGYLFVAMPDPWFISWEQPHSWCHWHVREHHIMWDMDSFIDECIAQGFELVYSFRNAMDFFCKGDFHVVLRKP